MNLEIKQQEKIRLYLLGRLPEDELAALDEGLVTDGEFYEELLIVEDELIDQYLSGQLSAAERESFETHFLLTTERHEKLRFANTFQKYVKGIEPAPEPERPIERVVERSADVPEPPPKRKWYSSFLPIQNPVLAYSFMGALVLIVAGVSWLAWKNLRNPGTELPGKDYIVELTPGGITRSGGAEKRITIPAGTSTVELRLESPKDDYKVYSAVLLADDGSEVWRRDNIKPSSESGTSFIAARVPVRSLPPGAYRLKVSGVLRDGKVEDLPGYQFRVIR